MTGVAPSVANRDQRMKDIRLRRRLIETIRLQDNEYIALKAELERLRMRTFPALVKVD